MFSCDRPIYKKQNLWLHTPVLRTAIPWNTSKNLLVYVKLRACYICPKAAVSFWMSLEKMLEL